MPDLAKAQRRSEELPHRRNPSGVVQQPGGSRGPSFDSISLPSAGLHHQDSFPQGVQDLLPLDLASRSTSESASTGPGSVPHQGFAGGNPAVSTPSTLNRLGALMFPSEDPFAYPNQPMMELGRQEGGEGGGGAGGDDTTQFFMQGPFDEMESHLLGQMPPFMMGQSQQGLEISPNMFSGPGMVPSQGVGRGGAQVQGQGQGRGATQGERERMEQLRRQQEQILAAQRYRDWDQYGRGGFPM